MAARDDGVHGHYAHSVNRRNNLPATWESDFKPEFGPEFGPESRPEFKPQPGAWKTSSPGDIEPTISARLNAI